MKNILELYAPWIIGDPWDCIHEGEGMIDLVNRMPISERWRIAKHLGERHRVTNAERERLGLRNISPCDMTKKDLAEAQGQGQGEEGTQVAREG